MHAGVPGAVTLLLADAYGNAAAAAGPAVGLRCVVTAVRADVDSDTGVLPSPKTYSTAVIPPTMDFDVASGTFTLHPLMTTPGLFSAACVAVPAVPSDATSATAAAATAAATAIAAPPAFTLTVAPTPWREVLTRNRQLKSRRSSKLETRHLKTPRVLHIL
jgi:hypothetical protein